LGVTLLALMQVDSVISNTITQDIRLKGHQSIRFTPDGFSVLVSDASYTPFYLKQYTFGSPVSVEELTTECGKVLSDADLISFEGETVLITDSMAVTPLPKQFLNVDKNRGILEQVCSLNASDHLFDRSIKNRDFHLLYAVPEKIIELSNRFTTDVKILHTAECLLSLSDQVKSSDHQRGVVLVEVQSHSLDILAIAGDQVQLINRYSLNDPSDFIYHTLNTMKQLELNCEMIPVYISGMIHEDHPLNLLLRKYIRNVAHTPYFLEHLTREQILRFMILSEGSKCG
jgi:hypothetical protein